MQGLIVAAGQGVRLRDIAISKPLAPVNGVPLIERVIGNARAGGIEAFVVVTGYEAERVEAFLADLASREKLTIAAVRNPAWELANGLSVAAAQALLGARFVLMMADHLLEPSIIADLMAQPAAPDEVVLAIDRRLDNPLVDLADVTRVRTDANGRITAIGKLLEPFDAFDTGVFSASHSLISAIRADVDAGGAGGISEGMRRLAAAGLARALDIGDRFWLDVDDSAAHGHAERLRA
ncbi:MAG: NTP transferase domain-containing protein [Caulobacteraceae bacterium]